jgi:hypothetical protein
MLCRRIVLWWFIFYNNYCILSLQMPPVRTSHTQLDSPRKNRFIGRIEAKQNIVNAANAENIPPDTAYKILRKYRQTGTTSNLPRSGRPRIVTDREEWHIIRDATNHRRKTLQELSKDTTSNLVQKVLDCNGYHQSTYKKEDIFNLDETVLWPL